MESKNIKPRIIEAMFAIGAPATAKEIANFAGIEEPIHARLKELTDKGDIIRISAPDMPIMYTLHDTEPEIDTPHEDSPPMSIPTEQLPLIATAYTTIYEDIKAQDAAMQKNMERYAKAILEADNTYQAMATACYHLNLILDEMASRNLI